jgi:hypothetical protein
MTARARILHNQRQARQLSAIRDVRGFLSRSGHAAVYPGLHSWSMASRRSEVD